MDVLDELNKKDQEYQQLLNPSEAGDEDDTFMLLGGSERYEPLPGQRVRPKAEAIADDRTRQKEKSAHDQLMIRLKTLHMELRSARQGIEYIERRLNGAGSSDEGEWVDDEDDPEGDIITRRARAEEKAAKKSKKADIVDAAASASSTADTANGGSDAALATKEPAPVLAESSTAVKVGTVTAQLVMIWFALEIYFLSVICPFQIYSPSQAKLTSITAINPSPLRPL
jgi:hypothetical protein